MCILLACSVYGGENHFSSFISVIAVKSTTNTLSIVTSVNFFLLVICITVVVDK